MRLVKRIEQHHTVGGATGDFVRQLAHALKDVGDRVQRAGLEARQLGDVEELEARAERAQESDPWWVHLPVILFFILWFVIGIPLGPGAPVR